VTEPAGTVCSVYGLPCTQAALSCRRPQRHVTLQFGHRWHALRESGGAPYRPTCQL
jgi:hypothetical protein